MDGDENPKVSLNFSVLRGICTTLCFAVDRWAEQVGDGIHAKLPLYALWLLDACLDVTGRTDKAVVECFVQVGGVHQVC